MKQKDNKRLTVLKVSKPFNDSRRFSVKWTWQLATVSIIAVVYI